ncbi:histidine phosphatase family protein [Pseudoclavibacter sp. 13-3]|uniref:histidine phosphatase family protein n=1 Tax=Pseudoclavibacter sp. 13-3 TaxID=2901228 RepID=UPI001E3153CF|nr:histidine phosphatase family protein [Pseudoclavibacter sp. 13-3]MCD7101966.1 histidine phosphatase family protein [Pseudoclavibacter sp. 13-3]
MTRIALIRHGETDLNTVGRIQGESDHGLNDRGRAQARRTGALLAGQPDAGQLRSQTGREWDAVVSSPQRRARETAREIAASLGVVPSAWIDDLCERRYGAAEGLTFGELFDRYQVPEQRRRQGFALDWLISHERIDGAEPIESVRSRGLRALALIAETRAPADAVVAVAHGTLIRCTLEAIEYDEPLHLENGGGILLDRTVTGGWRVVSQIGGSSER